MMDEKLTEKMEKKRVYKLMSEKPDKKAMERFKAPSFEVAKHEHRKD